MKQVIIDANSIKFIIKYKEGTKRAKIPAVITCFKTDGLHFMILRQVQIHDKKVNPNNMEPRCHGNNKKETGTIVPVDNIAIPQ